LIWFEKKCEMFVAVVSEREADYGGRRATGDGRRRTWRLSSLLFCLKASRVARSRTGQHCTQTHT
jgi:hypothetical protein